MMRGGKMFSKKEIKIHIVEKKNSKYTNIEVLDIEHFLGIIGASVKQNLPFYTIGKKKITEKVMLDVYNYCLWRLKANKNKKKNGKQSSKRKKDKK